MQLTAIEFPRALYRGPSGQSSAFFFFQGIAVQPSGNPCSRSHSFGVRRRTCMVGATITVGPVVETSLLCVPIVAAILPVKAQLYKSTATATACTSVLFSVNISPSSEQPDPCGPLWSCRPITVPWIATAGMTSGTFPPPVPYRETQLGATSCGPVIRLSLGWFSNRIAVTGCNTNKPHSFPAGPPLCFCHLDVTVSEAFGLLPQ